MGIRSLADKWGKKRWRVFFRALAVTSFILAYIGAYADNAEQYENCQFIDWISLDGEVTYKKNIILNEGQNYRVVLYVQRMVGAKTTIVDVEAVIYKDGNKTVFRTDLFPRRTSFGTFGLSALLAEHDKDLEFGEGRSSRSPRSNSIKSTSIFVAGETGEYLITLNVRELSGVRKVGLLINTDAKETGWSRFLFFLAVMYLIYYFAFEFFFMIKETIKGISEDFLGTKVGAIFKNIILKDKNP